MFERVIRFYSEPIYRLSRRLLLMILGFVILAQVLILIPALAGFHQSKIQNRMRELAFMAELRLRLPVEVLGDIKSNRSWDQTPLSQD